MEAASAPGFIQKSLNPSNNHIVGVMPHPSHAKTNGIQKNNYVNELQVPSETIYNFKGPIPLASRPSHEVKIKKNKNHRRTKTIMQQKAVGIEKQRYSMIHTPMNILDPTFQQQQHSFGQPSPLHKSQSSKEFFKNPLKQQHQQINFYQVQQPPSQALIAGAYQPQSRKQIQRDPLKTNAGGVRNFTKKGDEIFYYTTSDQVPTFPYGPRLSWHSNSPPRDARVLEMDNIQQQYIYNETMNAYKVLAQERQSTNNNYQVSQIKLEQQKGQDPSIPYQKIIYQNAPENDQQTIQSLVRNIVREEVSRAITSTSPPNRRNHIDYQQSLSANRLGSMRVLSPEYSVGGQTERDQVEQFEQAEMRFTQIKQKNATNPIQANREMSYVMGVSNASDGAGNSPTSHKKRPSKVIVIKKDEIMKPFQEISPITSPKREEKEGSALPSAILASGIRQSKAEFTQQKQIEISKVENARPKGQENRQESISSPVLLPPQVQEYLESLKKSEFLKPLVAIKDSKYLNIQIPLINQSPAQTIFNHLKQILNEMSLLFPSLNQTKQVSCATQAIEQRDKQCGNDQLGQKKDNSAQCQQVLLIDADLSAIIIEHKKEDQGAQTEVQSKKEQQIQTLYLTNTNETQTNVEICDQDVQMTKRCSLEQGAQTENQIKGQDQATQYELSQKQDQMQAAAIETFQVEEIITIKVDQVVQTEKVNTPKVVKIKKKTEKNQDNNRERKESSSLDSRIELVDDGSSSHNNPNSRKISKKNFSFMSSTIEPKSQNAIDNIRNILRNSTEQKAGELSQTQLYTEHNDENDGKSPYNINYAAKRPSRRILHARNQSMGGVASDFKRQLLQVHLKKVTIRKQERDQLQNEIMLEKTQQEEDLMKTLDKEEQQKVIQKKNALKGKPLIKLKNAFNEESDNSYYQKKCFQQSDLDDILIETERGLQELPSRRGTGRKHIENILNKISSKSTQALISKQ